MAGNQRVLRARLADARFFWAQDLRVPLELRVGLLKERVFHDKLGSVYDKAKRITALAEFLAGDVPNAEASRAGSAAWLAKADLSTGMVAEFPELQGVIGGYYYRHQHISENDDVQKQLRNAAIEIAIRDHYKPLGPTDNCPKEPNSIVVSLADKIELSRRIFCNQSASS